MFEVFSYINNIDDDIHQTMIRDFIKINYARITYQKIRNKNMIIRVGGVLDTSLG